MLKIHNTLTKKVEDFIPLDPNSKEVKIYSCGPTVYDYLTIGNYRTYTLMDILKRTLHFDGYIVKHVINITDVGHLTSDEDLGEDKMEKKAKKEGKSALEIARFYEEAFLNDLPKLNIIPADYTIRATDHIQEMIELISVLIEKGYAYETSHAIYFDVSKFPNYTDLSGNKLDEQLIGARDEVVVDDNKKHPYDFRLWQLDWQNHEMQWESPWGKGFPGWHIECSAMAIKYLGKHFDIHTGGVDLIPVHHTNEIAQSEAATEEKFVNYWIHGEHLLVDNQRMGKSLGNAYILSDIEKEKINPIALRYLYLTTHYRAKMNFTWESLYAANSALSNLSEVIQTISNNSTNSGLVINKYMDKFKEVINNDLNMPEALAVMWELIKDSKYEDIDKLATLLVFDDIFGFNLKEYTKIQIPKKVEELVNHREESRNNKNWLLSDKIRNQIEELGYIVKDTNNGQRIIKKNT